MQESILSIVSVDSLTLVLSGCGVFLFQERKGVPS
jgi:hypothetical protein